MQPRRWAWRWVAVAAAHILTSARASLPPSHTVPVAGFDGVTSRMRLWEAAAINTVAAILQVSFEDPVRGDDDFLTWAAKHKYAAPTAASQVCRECFLVVSVKTRVVHGFVARQLIRASWADLTVLQKLPIRVVFLGCEPKLVDHPHNKALALEKERYGDLLTWELGGCVDAYDRLADKVLGFFHWVTVHHPHAAYVMVADDDGYVRLDRVTTMLQAETTPRTRYYAGQVLATQLRRAVPTMRDRTSKYNLSVRQYAMSTLPPFAIGAHYVLSSDVAAFLAQNRDALATIGPLEDVSMGLWLRSLLQVHPVDVPSFRCTTHSLCHNSFASYGELSRDAMRQIHANVQSGNAFCHGFSFTSWATQAIHEPPLRKQRPRHDVTYGWAFRVCPHTRLLYVDVTVRLRESFVPVIVPFTPAMETREQLCMKLDETAAARGQRLPLMLCDDLTHRLGEFLPHHPLAQTALLALLQSNLSPRVVSSAAIKVWVSRRVLRWRAFVESLLGEMYRDVHVFVVDEMTAPDVTSVFDPDFAVVSASEVNELPDLPLTCRLLVMATSSLQFDHLQAQERNDKDLGTIVVTMDRHCSGHPDRQQLYVPIASLVFSDSLTHSPHALLHASSERHRTGGLYPMAVAVPHCNRRAAILLDRLRQDALDGNCTLELAHSDPVSDAAPSPATLFAFDADVTRYATAKFVLAFETAQAKPGYVASTIVVAFLAGSIPVYDGDDETVSWLFNPNAFISCGRFASLESCGDSVAEVHRSSSLYAQMRTEPPVVNVTAFHDVFSWHPDVLISRPHANDGGYLSMVERLRAMINHE